MRQIKCLEALVKLIHIKIVAVNTTMKWRGGRDIIRNEKRRIVGLGNEAGICTSSHVA
jgi:hypothetical protein